MNRKACVIIIALCLSVLGAVAQDIAAALGSGDYRALSSSFDTNVEMRLAGEEGTYSRSQAELVLKSFFASHKPQKFSISHQGGQENAKFAVGSLATASGTYRVHYLLKTVGDRTYIQKLIIE